MNPPPETQPEWTVFCLPDLGEGLPDAEIREWYVLPGASIQKDAPMVSMETAKAVVEIPSPHSGVVKCCHGVVGDVVQTGAPLVSFELEDHRASVSHTVVGQMEEGGVLMVETRSFRTSSVPSARVKASPLVRAEAKRRRIDLVTLQGSGPQGNITLSDLDRAVEKKALPDGDWTPLKGIRRTMAKTMASADQAVVKVTLIDDADVSAWVADEDLTVRVIQALGQAVALEGALNAWYDGEACAKQCFNTLNLGLATDTAEGLMVPVIFSAEQYATPALRTEINALKEGVRLRNLPPERLKGATFTLSNFGIFAGRYADPVVVPPTVGILGVGRLYESGAWEKDQWVRKKYLPLSLSFDHRAVTGGEASRFLKAILEALKA